MALSRAIRAPGDQVLAPERSMLPRACIPLQHDFFGRLGRIQIDVAEKLVAIADMESRLSVFEKLLTQPIRGAHHRFVATVNRMLGLRDKIPLTISTAIAGGL